MKSLDGGFLDGAFRTDGDADESQEVDRDGADDAEGGVAQADHFLVFAGERSECRFEEEAVGGERGFWERGILNEANDLAGVIGDGEFGAVALEVGEKFGLGHRDLGEAERDD